MRKRFDLGLANKVPIGYVFSDDKKKLPLKSEEFDNIMNAWGLMESGLYSLSEVARKIDDMGVMIKYKKKRIPMSVQYAGKLFRNKFYAGYLYSKKYHAEILGAHKPMISLKTFYRVQDILSGRNTRPDKARRMVNNPMFPLRGIVICKSCKRNLVSAKVKGRSKHYPKYWCSNNCIPSVDSEKLEKMLIKHLGDIQPDKELVSLFTLIIEVNYNKGLTTLKDKKKVAEKKILEQKEMMSLLVEGNISGKYSDEVYKEMRDKIDDKIMILEIIANDNKCDQYDIKRTVGFIRALFQDLPKAYELSDYAQKRVLLGSIYPSGMVFDGKSLLNQGLGTGFEAIHTFSKEVINSGAPGGNRTPI